MSDRKKTILVVDAEAATSKEVAQFLDADIFTVTGITTGEDAIRLSISLKPALILLDLDLPDMNGNDLITALRDWSYAPIIVLTARCENEDTMKALDLGADDYVTKPFNSGVLEARINANLRQSALRGNGSPEIGNGSLRMDLSRHEVYIDGKQVSFTPKEYELLKCFLLNSGKMLTHKELLREVWGSAHGGDARYLRVFISKIREKIYAAADSMPSPITTVAGIGYRMEIIVPAASSPYSDDFREI